MRRVRREVVDTGDRWWVIDTDDLSPGDISRACEIALDAVYSPEVEGECDIVWQPDLWPVSVLTAAALLRTRFIPARRHKADYVQTGMVHLGDADVWTAFKAHAPWALNARVWDGEGTEVAQLADECATLLVRLDESQARELATRLGLAQLRALR